MSNRGIREFIDSSGIRVESSSSPASTASSNNNFARELELELMKKQEVPPALKRNIVSNRRYEGMFKEFENDSESNLDNEFNDVRFKQALADTTFDNNAFAYLRPKDSLQVSKLNPGMFNATVNKMFKNEPRIDIKNILTKKPLAKSPIGGGLYVDTKEIRGIVGRMRTTFSHTREYGPKGGLNQNFFSAQLILEISNGAEKKGATVNFFKNGKIRFSGGFVGTNIETQPELLRRFVVDNYSDRESFLYNPFDYNNVSGQFKINGTFKNMGRIASMYRELNINSRTTYEPELSPFLYVYAGEHKYIITKTGNVQISGAVTPTAMLNAYNRGQQLMERIHEMGEIDVTGVFANSDKKTRKSKTKAKPKPKPKPKPKASPKKKRILNNIQVSVLKVNSKKCERMPKNELIDLARKMGVVNFRTTTVNGSRASTRKEICEKIRSIANKKPVTFKNVQTKKNVSLTGKVNTKNFRVGKKLCSSLGKPELLRIASILKLEISPKDTKVVICKKIEKARNTISNKPKTPPKPTKMQIRQNVAQKKRNAKREITIKRRKLNDNSIRNELAKMYGVRWMKRYKPNLNNDVRAVKNALNALEGNKGTGLPYKKDIKAVEKKMVNRWMFERKRNLERKYLENNANVTGIPYNLRNNYKKAVANYILNKNGRPVSKKAIDDYRKYWLKFRANMNTNGNARRNIGAARARIETL